jgi:hypothetical protein
MGDVINLNRYRKAKEKAERAKLAGESRVRHGRSKRERDAQQREEQRQADALAGKRLEPEEPIDN